MTWIGVIVAVVHVRARTCVRFLWLIRECIREPDLFQFAGNIPRCYGFAADRVAAAFRTASKVKPTCYRTARHRPSARCSPVSIAANG